MEDVALDHFNKFKKSTIPMAQFIPRLHDKRDQYDSTTAIHIHIILKCLITKLFIAPFLTTMWDHMYGCAKHYRFVSAFYLLSCLDLEFIIIIYRVVGAPGHSKDVVGIKNGRYKQMLKL